MRYEVLLNWKSYEGGNVTSTDSVDLDRAKRNAKIEGRNSKITKSKIPRESRHGQIWQLKMLLKNEIKTNENQGPAQMV